LLVVETVGSTAPPPQSWSQIDPARAARRAPLPRVCRRVIPAQAPWSDCIGENGESPLVQGPAARLQQRECDACQHDESGQRAANGQWSEGQLIPDSVRRGGEGHERSHLTRCETQEQRVLDIEMVRHFVCSRHAGETSYEPNAACRLAM